MKFTNAQLRELENRGMIEMKRSNEKIIRFKTSIIVCSANKWTNKKNGDRIYQGYKKQVQRHVDIYFKPGAVVARPAMCWFERLYSGREKRFDDDNYRHGVKPIIDRLVNNGYLIDDNDTVFYGHYKQTPADESGLEITIEYEDRK